MWGCMVAFRDNGLNECSSQAFRLNSAIFSLLDALLLRPLPVRKPGELVRLVQVAAPLGPRSFFTYNTYRALAQRNKCFAAVFGYSESNVAVRDNGRPHSVRCHLVTGRF